MCGKHIRRLSVKSFLPIEISLLPFGKARILFQYPDRADAECIDLLRWFATPPTGTFTSRFEADLIQRNLSGSHFGYRFLGECNICPHEQRDCGREDLENNREVRATSAEYWLAGRHLTISSFPRRSMRRIPQGSWGSRSSPGRGRGASRPAAPARSRSPCEACR